MNGHKDDKPNGTNGVVKMNGHSGEKVNGQTDVMNGYTTEKMNGHATEKRDGYVTEKINGQVSHKFNGYSEKLTCPGKMNGHIVNGNSPKYQANVMNGSAHDMELENYKKSHRMDLGSPKITKVAVKI